jgi:hypothetical protein
LIKRWQNTFGVGVFAGKGSRGPAVLVVPHHNHLAEGSRLPIGMWKCRPKVRRLSKRGFVTVLLNSEIFNGYEVPKRIPDPQDVKNRAIVVVDG